MQSYKKAVSYVGISCVFLTSAAFAFLFLGEPLPVKQVAGCLLQTCAGKRKAKTITLRNGLRSGYVSSLKIRQFFQMP